MKKYVSIFILLFVVLFSSFAGDRAEVWSRMYKRSFSPEMKFSVMLNIVELNDRGMIPLLEEILTEDIIANLDNKRDITEEQRFIELTKLVVKELGELKSKNSAVLVYTIVKETKDPLLKADAIIALGNMRADQYVDDISLILRNVNMRPLEGLSSEIEAESKVAYGSVSALDRFRNVIGYESVFFASVGWYDQRVRFFADKVLKTITDNPIEPLTKILIDGSFSDKEKAILEVAQCSAPAGDKIEAAREALKQGLVNIADTIQDGLILTSIRKNAIKVLYNSKSSKTDDIYYLSQSVNNGADLEEKIYAIRTLGLNATDEAISELVKILTTFNDRSISGLGITYAEESVVKEIISTLGKSGNSLANGVLTEVQFSGYSSGIIKLAKDALKKMN